MLEDAVLIDLATDRTDPDDQDDSEPSIAVNPKDPAELAVVAFSGTWSATRAAPIWRSSDGGGTWRMVPQLQRPAADAEGPADQKIAFAADGRLGVVTMDRSNRSWLYALRGDAPSLPVASLGQNQDQPMVDVAAGSGPCANNVYLPWLDKSAATLLAHVSLSQLLGSTATTTALVSRADPDQRTARIALAKRGTAYVVFKTRVGFVDGDFENANYWVRRSDDCGATWDAVAGGARVSGEAAVQTWFTRDGDAFGNPSSLSGGFGNPRRGKVARARSSDAWIAVDPSDGDVYAAYVRRDESGFTQINVARSADRGATWRSTRVSDGSNHSAFPEIAVAENGMVGVLYIDYDDAWYLPHTRFGHRFARSADDGATFVDGYLQVMDPSGLDNAVSGWLWGDYEGLTASGQTFYGVFTGASIGRTRPQLDPIFFRAPAALPP